MPPSKESNHAVIDSSTHLWSDVGQPPSVCNFMCRLKPHGIIACRTFAYFVQSWGNIHRWGRLLVSPPLSRDEGKK
ncbi:hypothetical protein N7447_007090 [Penicillium robsamsonii]|uniref:uncharacterized protein n=1 Tax=Penicillium robsamsonii TaxID=1792511 RepID=UPI002546DB7B|nr:uncharacterized protein N7447_007090 [Penicillium robsamsonii]KAJ5824750.1 hypothetical protein N7447_007090 [Penicillium robsamsonii]